MPGLLWIGCGGLVLVAIVLGFWLVSVYNTLARGKVGIKNA